MEKIYTHMGINEEKLRRKNSIILDDGNEVLYDIDYNKRLIVNMEFVGKENNQKSNVNSCGWKRDSRYYFKKLLTEQPEFFSQENKWAIEDGISPVCDRTFIDFFPEYKDFLGDRLIHHHIGEDGQAVALPESLHTGYGIVHNVEKELGVTKNGHEFSTLVDIDYKAGKKFEWENAEQLMENLRKNSSDNKTHRKQKDVRKKGGRLINGDGISNVMKTLVPMLLPILVPRIVEFIKNVVVDSRNQDNDEFGEENDEEYKSTLNETGNRSQVSPKEHDVKGHGQHYNTRDGRIWKEKEPYTRGNKDKED